MLDFYQNKLFRLLPPMRLRTPFVVDLPPESLTSSASLSNQGVIFENKEIEILPPVVEQVEPVVYIE